MKSLLQCFALFTGFAFLALMVVHILSFDSRTSPAKKAIVLQGGGAKGAYEVGSLQKMCQAGQLQDVELLVGTSIGAMTAAFLAQFSSDKLCSGVDELQDIWLSMSSRQDIIQANSPTAGECDFLTFRHFLQVLGVGGVLGKYRCTMAPGDKLYDKHIQMQRIAHSGIKLDVATVSLEDGSLKYCSEDMRPLENLKTCIKASGTLSPVVQPRQIRRERFMDGGIRANLALLRALERGANEVHMFLTSDIDASPAVHGKEGYMSYMSFFLDVAFDTQLVDEVRYACLRYPYARISAEMPVGENLGSLLNFHPANIKKLIAEGKSSESVPDVCKYMKMDRSALATPASAPLGVLVTVAGYVTLIASGLYSLSFVWNALKQQRMRLIGVWNALKEQSMRLIGAVRVSMESFRRMRDRLWHPDNEIAQP